MLNSVRVSSTGVRVERPGAEAQLVAASVVAAGTRRLRGTSPMPQLHRDAGGELVEVEGLREVVVRAEPEQVDLVGGRGAGGDDDDGHVGRALAHERGELLAGEAGQHEVADHEVEGERLRCLPGRAGLQEQARLGAGIGLRASVALARQARRDDVVDVGVVLDDQDARLVRHRHSPR